MVFVSRFDLRTIFPSSCWISASNSVLELRLLARFSSEFSKLFSSPALGNEVRLLNTLPSSSLMKSYSFACLASSIALAISVSVMLAVDIVSGPMLFAFPGELWGELELRRSLINIGHPRPNVLFFTVAMFGWSSAVGLLLYGGGVSGSLSDSNMYTFFCFDVDFVNWPSGHFGPVPLLLLQSWSKSVPGLLVHFLCNILPFGVFTVCFGPNFAIFGLSA